MSRPTWDKFFMNIARTTAERATCDRKHVGCVIVRDNVQLTGGYNGSMRGDQHCDDVGHLMEGTEIAIRVVEQELPPSLLANVQPELTERLSHCVRTVHAEANAIALAAREGIALRGATMYVTAFPCWNCFKLAVNAGIVRIIYGEVYRQEDQQRVVEHSRYLRCVARRPITIDFIGE